jgi:hypothetical protein
MPNWKKLITSGSAASLSSLSLDTALPVSEGGTGATTLTSNGILTGNGTSAIQAEANLTFDASSNLNLLSDSGKLRIGAGNNLEIYHNGTNDFIDSGGTAMFFRQGTTEKLKFNSAGNIQFNNAQADINTRFGTTGSTNTLWIDGGTDRVGIGTDAPGYKLDVNGGIRNYANGSAVLRTESTAAGYGAYNKLITTTNTYDVYALNGDFKIDENGVATRFIIKDTTGNVGIGVDTPDSFVHISASVGSSTASLHVEGSGSEVFAVDGTNGRLFTITDELSGSLFSANTIAGLPVIEAFSDYKVTLGPYSSQTTVDSSGNLSVSGEIRATGDVIAYYSSDERFKDNIQPIQDSLYKISKIGGYEYDWNDKQSTYEGHDVGVIAQEIHKVLPEVVTEREDGYLAVKYEKVVPLLIESIKELKQEVDDIKKNCKCLSDGNEL